MNRNQKVYGGMDVSKENLETFLDRKTARFAHTMEDLASRMKKTQNVHDVLESIGG